MDGCRTMMMRMKIVMDVEMYTFAICKKQMDKPSIWELSCVQ